MFSFAQPRINAVFEERAKLLIESTLKNLRGVDIGFELRERPFGRTLIILDFRMTWNGEPITIRREVNDVHQMDSKRIEQLAHVFAVSTAQVLGEKIFLLPVGEPSNE